MILLADLSATSPSAPGTVVSKMVSPSVSADTIGNLSEYDGIFVTFNLQGAAGGTLDVYLQSWDGVDWLDYYHHTQLAAGAAATSFVYVPQYPTVHTVVTIGRNTSPALAAGSSVGNHPGESMRLLFVAGGGTTAGALQTVRLFARRAWARA